VRSQPTAKDKGVALAGKDVFTSLKGLNYRVFTGVACSYFKSVLSSLVADREVVYAAAAHEGVALSIAAGAAAAGSKSVVMLQNSGVGNLINPLTSLSLIYAFPALLIISLRGYPADGRDEPQHRIMGTETKRLLEALGVANWMVPTEMVEFRSVLGQADDTVDRGNVAALLLRKGTIDGGEAREQPNGPFSMRRMDAIQVIAKALTERDAVIATTGKISRELFVTRDRPGNFYMQGSMGHALSIGLGTAITAPNRRVVVLDGDGAAIMHMGSLSTAGHYAPSNLVHIVLDNEAYGSTGNQPSTSSTSQLDRIALACGYRQVHRCVTPGELTAALASVEHLPGPTCILVKVNRREPDAIPRVTREHTPEALRSRFSGFLRET